MRHFQNGSKIATLRVAVSEWLPWTWVKIHSNGSVSVPGGFMKQLLDMISKHGHFNYTILSPADRQWGTPLPNGSFTGMIGMLERNEADIGLGPFTATYPRWSVARFGKMFRMMHLTILAGAQDEKGGNVFSYILTFDWQIWLGLLVALIVATLVSSLIDITLPKPNWRFSRLKPKLISYFWEYIGTIFCESMPGTPPSNAGRIIMAIWWLSIIVLMNGFTGNMKAKMLVRPEIDKINSVKDLVQRPYIRPYVMKGTAYETYIKTSESKVFQDLWKMVVKHDGLILADEMFNMETLEEVRTGKAVFISDFITLKYNVGAKCMDLKGAAFYFSKESFYPHLFTISHRKDLRKDVLNLINSCIRRLFEGGIWKRLLTKVHHDFGKCAHQEQNREEQTLSLEDLTGLFVLYFICLFGASVILAFERILTHKKSNNINIALFHKKDPVLNQSRAVSAISKHDNFYRVNVMRDHRHHKINQLGDVKYE